MTCNIESSFFNNHKSMIRCVFFGTRLFRWPGTSSDNISSNPLATPRPLGRLRRPHRRVPPPIELLRPARSEQQPTTLDGPKVTKTMDF